MYKTVHSCIYVCRKAVIPIESEPSPVDTDYDSQWINVDDYTSKMTKLRDGLFVEEKTNIKGAQARIKRDYDQKNGWVTVIGLHCVYTNLFRVKGSELMFTATMYIHARVYYVITDCHFSPSRYLPLVRQS